MKPQGNWVIWRSKYLSLISSVIGKRQAKDIWGKWLVSVRVHRVAPNISATCQGFWVGCCEKEMDDKGMHQEL